MKSRSNLQLLIMGVAILIMAYFPLMSAQSKYHFNSVLFYYNTDIHVVTVMDYKAGHIFL